MSEVNCPRYQRCSAAICPLWRPILKQKMIKGERVCGVLLEYQKEQSKTFLMTHYSEQMLQVMAEATDQIKAHGGYLLRSALSRASNTGTRLSLVLDS
jgi:hypothetical protein